MKTALITGEMGSGKTELIRLLGQKSYPIFIADEEAKKFLSPKSSCYSSLKALFPEKSFYLADGNFNQKAIARCIFQDSRKRQAMEALIHPLVWQSFKNFCKKQKKEKNFLVFCEVPLISSSFFSSFDVFILVLCPVSIRKTRLIKSGWGLEDVESRFFAQISSQKVKNLADFVIDNKGSLKNLKAQLDEILKQLNKPVCSIK